MSDILKMAEVRCPRCDGLMKIKDENAKIIHCEYCGNEYVVDVKKDTPPVHKVPQWEPVPQKSVAEAPKSSAKSSVVSILVSIVCLVALVGYKAYQRAQDQEAAKQLAQREMIESMAENYNVYDPHASSKEEDAQAALSGMLEQMVATAFGKDADSVTPQELAQIQWIADKGDFDNAYMGYSFDNPLENPDAELIWLTFPSRSDRGYEGLYLLTGLKKLETGESLRECALQGLELESLSATYSTLADLAGVLDDPSSICQLSISSSVKSLDGLELFPNLESLTINARNFADVDAVVALGQLKSLTLENADAISDFGVFASMTNLEELSIESENLKTLDFLKRMPQLKSLGLTDGKLLSLDGLEVLEKLEKLTVTDCRDLKNMDAVAALTGLVELYLEKPSGCEEPSLGGLTGLRRLTLRGFHDCDFLSRLTGLEELTLRSCELPSGIDLSGLTQLRRLTCATSYQDMSLAFVENIPSLESVNLGGAITYEDISGLFALPSIREIKMSGMECEIDFDKVSDNPSLETLEMAGVKLYENVKVYSSMGITNVYYDDVFLTEHLDFFGHFPNLKKLDVAENEIRELEFAESLANLEEIDFSDNYVTDMRVLASLPSLRLVNCAGNPISNLRVLDETRVHVISE